ncbi:alpha/beta hydrolase [Roseicyclus persicicus]|uniref:Alpha/beta hydrolase fold domain-containing protein n=1 Tax=Roseicyclus persicicus TaxID=2650661 RepID=A0A7X6JX47_9RHOB|nr:alpha/beta hydrolase fold domain-containing protein [Roseibacterium persicicum]NKX45147.1 alpha/beta hydrolase fold domain-containing protein [Roseibacterium persicicum]
MPITDWDDAYANAAHIPGAERFLADWPARTAALRDLHPPEVLRYGPGARQMIDLFRPETAVQGLTVVVHGGYWMRFSPDEFGFLAGGPLARGQAVAALRYTLATEARIAEITREIAAAIRVAAAAVPGPIHLTGHSAGGHLVTRMVCEGVLEDAVAARIGHVLSVSGVHDLRPLLRTGMNATLRLDAAEAAAESPALLLPRPGVRVTCAVGADERPEFRRQTDLLANVWWGLGAETRAVHLPGLHHFDVIDGLAAPDGALTRLLLDQSRS